jgi:hypothetical protein
MVFSPLNGSKTVVVDTHCCRSLPRFGAPNRNLRTYQTSCRGTQKESLSNGISLLKSRILPQFAAIYRAEKVVNNL